MAFALLINSNTVVKKPAGHLNLGDIAEFREDWQHPPTSTEQVMFDVMWFRGYTKEEVESKLPKGLVRNAYKIKGKWYLGDELGEDPGIQEEKEVWCNLAPFGEDEWYFYNSDPRLQFHTRDLTPQQISDLESAVVDITIKNAIVMNMASNIRDEEDNWEPVRIWN